MTDNLPKGKEDLIELEGSVEYIKYRNDNNGYTVCEVGTSDEDYVTVVGIMPFLSEGESISALGKWETNPSYGRQFKVEYYEKQLPASEASIFKYLCSGVVKGVGKVLAKRIVERFGTDTFDVIEHNPEWLSDINGITPKKAKKIADSFKDNFGVRSVMMFCRDFFGPATAVKVYKTWGGASVDIIKDNPYRLCQTIHGIGFGTADKIAESLGIKKNSPERLEAGTEYYLSYNATQNGHTFLPKERLVAAAARELSVSEEEIKAAIEALLNIGRLISVKYGDREVIYLKDYFNAERYTAAKLDLLDKSCEHISVGDIERFITQIESELDISYAALQKKAIINAVNSGVTVLTGGPGTGKTTVIRAVITVFERMGFNIMLAAPTGRAAKRMSDATGRMARTIHRVLETEFSSEKNLVFRRNENDMLDEDVIIIDEISMVDMLLMSALLKAVKPGARLLLIGDADQLPSVGAGSVLADILASERFPSIRLTEIFRQASASRIVTNAHAVNNGKYPDLKTERESNFFFMARQDERSSANTVAELCSHRLPRTYGDDVLSGIQVITPSHKGATGTEYLNVLLQSVLNPSSPKKAERKVRNVIFRVGDKIMQIKNNYDIAWYKNGEEGNGVFNGDIGIITDIDTDDEVLAVDFEGRIAEYSFSELDELEHAFAITVHKSQGSEYPIVILPVCRCAPQLLTRNLLYTAITRARDMVILVGSPQVVRDMVDNNRQVERYTGLAFLLRSYCE